MKNLLGDTGLFQIILSGIVVVSIDNNRRIGKILLIIHVTDSYQIFVMIVWKSPSMFVSISAQDCVGIRISLALNFPVSVDKSM